MDWIDALSFSALAFSPRFALITNRLTFDDVLLLATCFTFSENLDASIINEGFGAFYFKVGRGLWHEGGYYHA